MPACQFEAPQFLCSACLAQWLRCSDLHGISHSPQSALPASNHHRKLFDEALHIPKAYSHNAFVVLLVFLYTMHVAHVQWKAVLPISEFAPSCPGSPWEAHCLHRGILSASVLALQKMKLSCFISGCVFLVIMAHVSLVHFHELFILIYFHRMYFLFFTFLFFIMLCFHHCIDCIMHEETDNDRYKEHRREIVLNASSLFKSIRFFCFSHLCQCHERADFMTQGCVESVIAIPTSLVAIVNFASLSFALSKISLSVLYKSSSSMSLRVGSVLESTGWPSSVQNCTMPELISFSKHGEVIGLVKASAVIHWVGTIAICLSLPLIRASLTPKTYSRCVRFCGVDRKPMINAISLCSLHMKPLVVCCSPLGSWWDHWQ